MSSRKARIGKQIIATLPAGTTVWDTEIKGFGVRLQSATPSYFLKTRVAGRQRWLTIGRHGSPWTPESARKEALRLLHDATSGRDPKPPRPPIEKPLTVAEVVARYRAEHLPKLKPRSRDLYERSFDRFILPKIGRRPFADLSPSDVGQLHVALKDTPRQANTTLTVLSSLIAWGMDQRLRPRAENPCASLRRFKERKRERYLSLAELNRLAEVLDENEASARHSIHALAAIRLLILTGARLSEILTLEWSHVSLDDARLLLPDSKTGSKGIMLNRQAVDLLRSLPRESDNRFVIIGHRRGSHLVNLHGTWSDIRAEAGLQDIRIHDLRHSFASFAAHAGASLPLIGKLLGHNSPSTTARYAHITEARARSLNADVGDVIEQAMVRRSSKDPSDEN